jgi:hypothetical protein
MRPTTPASQPANEDDDAISDESDAPRPTLHQPSASVATTGSQGRKPSMSNWASAAVGSFLRKEKSGEFEQLRGDNQTTGDLRALRSQSETPSPLTRSRSGRAAPPLPRSRAQSSLSEPHSSKRSSPRIPLRSLPSAEKQSPKVMRALYAFNGGSDELSMEVGDEIIVLAEPSETWWRGESKGVKGLFPVNYTEEMPKKPPLPARPSTLNKSSHSQPSSPLQEFPVVRSRSNSANANRTLTAGWKDEPFGDHHSALSPIAHSPDYRQTTHSRGDEDDDDDDERGLVDKSERSSGREDVGTRGGINSAHPGVVRQLSRSLSNKKAPPPPPPSRRNNSSSAHRMSPSASNSATNSLFITPNNPESNWSTQGAQSKSPFDEGDPYDGAEDNDMASFSDLSLSHRCRACDCDDFQQSLFKNDGFCNSCFHSHTT